MLKRLLEDKQFASRTIVVLLVFSSFASALGMWLFSLERRGYLHSDRTEEWRPVLIAWSLCAVVATFVLTVARRQSIEPISSSRKMLSGVAIALFALSVGFESIYTRLSFALEREWPNQLSTNAVHRSFALHLDCEGCVGSVESFVRKQTLAEKARVNFQTQEIVIWINPAKTTFEALLHKMRAHGYTVSEKQ